MLRSLPQTLRIERELPGGGMARVFLAEDRALGRPVVVKVLSPDLAEGLSNERFKREIQLAAQLQHPHLVPVLQAGEAEGLPYFVMPYVAGESLRQRLAQGTPLPPREVVAILRDVARAMAYAHERGIVHRDIKPDNVLLSGGSAVVSDFGIAKALSSSRTDSGESDVLTRAGSSLGTPTYMAPEQAAADPNADHRVDLYAFGIMAYELFTGKPPFHGRPPQALLTAHLVEAPRHLAAVVPSLPRGLADLIMRCVEKDPAHRPASAGEVIVQLDGVEWSGERPATRRPASATVRWVAAAGLIGVLVAAATWLWRQRADASVVFNPALVAVVPFRVASADPALHYLREGMLDLLAAKLPGEGGLQATEPRMLLEAWRAAGGDEAKDLPTRESHRLSRRMGAGWLLLGDVVGTPSRVILNAALFHTGGKEPQTRVSIEGPPDSLGGLIDGLVAKLLTNVAEGSDKGTRLTQAPLPALRAYLDGVTKLRRGLPSSVAAFSEAVNQDSTFAPAALGLIQAMGWFSDGGGNDRALRLAWAGRQQLNAKDQALLAASAGPNYPEPSTTRQVYEAGQRYLQLAPERADAWYIFGDKLYHFGYVLGFPDRATRSADAFRRALALDSTYVPGYIHLQQLAVELGDTALEARLMRLRLAADTASYWTTAQRMYRALAQGDSATLRQMWATLPPRDNSALYSINRTGLFAAGVGAAEGLRAWDTLIARSSTPAQARANNWTASALALASGRPRRAREYLEQSVESLEDIGLLSRRILDAVFEAGDSSGAAEAAAKLLPLTRRPISQDSNTASRERAALRAVLTWRLSQGDTSGVRPLLARLWASLPPVRPGLPPTADELSLTALEALLADRSHSPTAAAQALHLDSLFAGSNFADLSTTRQQQVALIAGRLLEKHHTPQLALRAIRRRSSWWNNEMPYLATQLREEGRLAALTGQREEAIAAYRHYMALRQHAEPELQPEVESVRRALGELEVGGE